MYSESVLDHFQHPRNAGELPGADAEAEAQNPACGDVLRLAARVENQRLTEVRFRARGCTASIAAGSALTELVTGRTVAEARCLRRDELLQSLGGLPSESIHASYLALDALAALLARLAEM
ncbi:MAG: iron-sulfur cluster assembly scaffold protein [Acidobacteria bacterium]|nr:iron-sulfur cluster assembly scaffold protein [Acidobacteriota bacterium]